MYEARGADAEREGGVARRRRGRELERRREKVFEAPRKVFSAGTKRLILLSRRLLPFVTRQRQPEPRRARGLEVERVGARVVVMASFAERTRSHGIAFAASFPNDSPRLSLSRVSASAAASASAWTTRRDASPSSSQRSRRPFSMFSSYVAEPSTP